MELIKSSSSVSLDAVFVARFVAAAFDMVAECATSCAAKLRNKSLVCHQPNVHFYVQPVSHYMYFYFLIIIVAGGIDCKAIVTGGR